MKTENIIFVILWVVMAGVPQVSQADDRAVMQGVMDVMRTMQQQSGARDNPGSKAMMDIFDDAMSGRDDGRDRRDGRGEQRRRPHDYDDDRSSRRGESQRRGRDYDDDDRSSRRGESQRRGRDYDDDDRSSRRGEQQRRGRDDDSAGLNRQGSGRSEPQRRSRGYDDNDGRSERQRGGASVGADSGGQYRSQD